MTSISYILLAALVACGCFLAQSCRQMRRLLRQLEQRRHLIGQFKRRDAWDERNAWVIGELSMNSTPVERVFFTRTGANSGIDVVMRVRLEPFPFAEEWKPDDSYADVIIANFDDEDPAFACLQASELAETLNSACQNG